MKVLMLNGSPHEKGCTYTALDEISKALKQEGIDSEIFWIGSEPIASCMACGGCRKAGKCVINDRVNIFAEKAKESDGFIFGSPVHFAGASGAITSFLSRLFYSVSRPTVFRHKPGSIVVSARRAGTTATYDQLIKYLGISEMPIISSRYWNMVHGNTPEEVAKDLEGLQTMRILGKNMAYFLKCIETAKANGVKPPKSEEKIDITNFIK